MTKILLSPKSQRAGMDYSEIAANFKPAARNLRGFGATLRLASHGVDWFPLDMSSRNGKTIEYFLRDPYVENRELIEGEVGNVGRNNIGVIVYNGSAMDFSNLRADYVIGALAYGTYFAKKCEAVKGLKLFEEGVPIANGPGKAEGKADREASPADLMRYRAFLSRLIDRAEKIILPGEDSQFDDYTIMKMPSGLFVAHSRFYKNATYIFLDLADIKKRKSLVRANGDAITVDRDGRVDWEGKIWKVLGEK